MKRQVVEQLEATIQAGEVDVLVEVVESDHGRTAQVAVTNLEGEDGLDLSLKDVGALRDLADRTIATLTQPVLPQPDPTTRLSEDRRDDLHRTLTADVTTLLGSLDWALRWIEETAEVPLQDEEPGAFAEYEKARSHLLPPATTQKPQDEEGDGDAG